MTYGAWTLTGNSFSIDFNQGYARCDGTLSGTQLTGTCSNVTGYVWTFVATKQ